MSIIKGKNIAIERAQAALRMLDLHERCKLHGFPPFQNGLTESRVFGKDVLFYKSDMKLIERKSLREVKTNQYILFLHYLLSDIAFSPSGQYISFRQLPGGQFYWEPFIAKSCSPLIRAIGNDIELLKQKLTIYDWEQTNYGDFSARIHILGNIHLLLVHYSGNDEFPANINILFDSNISRIYQAEDISIMSSEICFGLLKS